ncbi:TonB-dependent receptor [Lysobacteraceae bacterium NML07-0707]|nr:TonB-dependent receptor [Xanthomonadaceae bacterium NML07-0707]
MLNTKKQKLTSAIQIALFVSAATLVSGTAFAQEESKAKDLDRIEVTGSRIRSADVETAKPVFTISRQALEAQGVVSVADVLQNMTAAGSPPISRSRPLSSGESVGGQYIDLRNLGANRTLVLVNGKRLPISTDGLQDISAIPNIMVERIDVLKDGASSTYGSDAIAGVINIITRKNYEGAEVEAYYGQYSQGDGAKERVSGVVGVAGERGYITVGAEYRKEDEVWAKNRWFSTDSYPGYPQYSYTSVGQWGTYTLDAKPGRGTVWHAANKGGNALGSASFHRQACPDDCSKPSDQMHVLTPLTARTLSLSAGYDLSDNIRWNTDISYSQREAVRQIAGYPLQSAAKGVEAPMSANSYFNPTGGAQDVHWRRRGWEMPRITTGNLTSWRFVTSLEGSFEFGERYMDWEAGYSYADNKLVTINTGNFNVQNVRAAVGPSFMNASGVVQCGTPANPIPLADCVPWNPFAGFGTGAVTNSLADPALQKFLYPTEHATGNTSTKMVFANISGNLFTLPAGDLGYALGYEKRTEKGGYYPDALAQSGQTTNLAAGPTFGKYDVTEVFAELHIPVLSGVTGFQELSFDLASRHSRYSTFGNTTNSKFGLKWKPVEDLLVRGTWAQGFRAPAISDLYATGSQSFDTFADPCDSVYGVARGTPACLADVPANFRQLKQGFLPSDGVSAQTPVPFISGSNPLLQPEKSRSWSAGLVYSPSFLEGLNVALDWWRVRIDDTMVGDSATAILDDCYVKGVASRCTLFRRDPSLGHIVTDLRRGDRNAGFTDIEGYDLSVAYRFDTERFGRFGINSDSTYFSRYASKSTNDVDTPISQSVSFGSTFRLRSNLGLSWDYGNFGVTWTARYYSAMKERCEFDERCNLPNYQAPDTLGKVVPHHRNGSTTFNDVQFRVKTPWNGMVSFGANNVFGRYAPVMYSQPSSNYAYYGGFDIGRFWYFKYTQKF